jgi:hypothetical protein
MAYFLDKAADKVLSKRDKVHDHDIREIMDYI